MNSIVDYLNTQGKASDFSSRAKLATENGIQNYTGTVEQNTSLLGKLQNFQGMTGGNISGTPIPAETIGTPTPLIKLPEKTQVNTPTINVTSPNGTVSDQNGTASVAPPSEKTQFQQLSERFSSLGNTLATKGDVETQLQNETQLAQKTEQATKDYNTYNQAKLGLQQQIERISTQSGITKEQAQQQVSEITQRGNANLANLAVIAQSSQGLEDAARQTIKDKLEAQFQPIQDQIDYLTKFAQFNANDLTESEKIALQEKADKKKTDYSLVSGTADALNQALLQNKAPASIYSAIDRVVQDYTSGKITASEAQAKMYQASGSYGVDAYKQAQLSSLNADIAKKNAETKALSNPTITNPEAGKYTGALGVILGSSKLTKDQKQSVINSINSGEDPLAVIKNQAKDIMGQTTATKLTSYETARDTLTDLTSQLQTFYANGGSTDIFKGNFEKVYNKLGLVKDPKLLDLATQIQGNIQVYRNAISGTAYSEQEGRDIASIFPGINKTQGLNEAILSARDRLFNATIDSMYRSVLGKTYDEAKNTQTASDPLGLGITSERKSDPLGILTSTSNSLTTNPLGI